MDTSTEHTTDDRKYAEIAVPANTTEFIMDHFGLFDVTEVSLLAFHIFANLAKLNRDGYKLALYKPGGSEQDVFEFNVENIITQYRTEMSKIIQNKKQTNTISNEKHNM